MKRYQIICAALLLGGCGASYGMLSGKVSIIKAEDKFQALMTKRKNTKDQNSAQLIQYTLLLMNQCMVLQGAYKKNMKKYTKLEKDYTPQIDKLKSLHDQFFLELGSYGYEFCDKRKLFMHSAERENNEIEIQYPQLKKKREAIKFLLKKKDNQEREFLKKKETFDTHNLLSSLGSLIVNCRMMFNDLDEVVKKLKNEYCKNDHSSRNNRYIKRNYATEMQQVRMLRRQLFFEFGKFGGKLKDLKSFETLA